MNTDQQSLRCNYTIEPKTFNSIITVLTSLIMYIECLPAEAPLLWFADKKTPVRQLPDFRVAKEIVMAMQHHECQNNEQILTFEWLLDTTADSVQKNGHYLQGQPYISKE